MDSLCDQGWVEQLMTMGNEIVRILDVGLRLGSWTDGTGVISCLDCKWLKLRRKRFLGRKKDPLYVKIRNPIPPKSIKDS